MRFSVCTSRLLSSGLLVAAVSLSACSDNDLLPPEDDHDHIETSGRLVIAQSGAPTVHVFDLDDEIVIESYTLDFPASAVFPSPDRRYAVIPQRSDNRTQFIDGGIWQEEHGDHFDDYREDPLLLAMRLNGVRPTHFEVHDELAALFFDGNSAVGGQVAGIALLTDDSITNGNTEATLDLPVAMHGTAEPRGDFLLTTYRDAAATTTLPSAVELYQRNGSGYDFVEHFAEGCADLHGSYSNETHSAFGCSDGVLLVEQLGSTFTASKVSNPAGMAVGARIGTIIGHHELAEFGGFSGSDLYVIDPDSGSMNLVDWNGASAETLVTHAMDGHGENFLILDSAGTLHFLDPANGWNTLGSVSVVSSISASPAPRPTIAVSLAGEVAFVTDPDDQSVAIIDLETRTVAERIDLGFTPAGFTWLGLSEHDH